MELTSYADMQALVGQMAAGQVQALLVRGTDVLYGLAGSTNIVQALANVPLVVSFSNMANDTTLMADLILPEHNALEDWGTSIPNPGPGYQTVGFQQPVVRPFFEARGEHLGGKNFADVLMATAQVLGVDLGFTAANFKELIESDAKRLFDSGRGSVRASTFREFWHGVLQRGGWWDTGARYSGPAPTAPQLPASVQAPSFGQGEFALIPFESTGLADGSGAALPWLQALPDPVTTAAWRTWVEINAKRAEELDIKEGDVVRLVTSRGSIEALAYPHPGLSPEVVSVPIGQGQRGGDRYSKDRGANVLSILDPLVDSESGQLAWAATRVRIEKTGRWDRLPMLDNTAVDRSVDEHHVIVQLTSG